MNHFEEVLWAKKKVEGSRLLWLPLWQHMEDTGFVMGQLWEHWLSQGVKDFIGENLYPLDEEEIKKLCVFLGYSHDLGKACASFQSMSGVPNQRDLDARLMENLERHGFTGISQLVLSSSRETPHALMGQALFMEYGVGEDISSIVGGHHGKAPDSMKAVREHGPFCYDANYFQVDDKKSEIYKKWDEGQRNLFARILRENRYSSIEELPSIPQKVQILLSGLLIMADWIASNERYFPLIDLEEEGVQDQEKRRIEGWRKWEKTNLYEGEYLPEVEEVFQCHFGFSPRNVQEVFSHCMEKTENPGIFILEAPMGIGKTEAALAGVEILSYKKRSRGMFFGLPTQATSNGLYPRVYDWLKKWMEETENTTSIRLLHGKASLNEEFAGLAENINVDESRNESVQVNQWFSGRKTASLDDFVIGTVDQFLLLALKQKHLALRHLGFSKKVIVLDEIHSYDTYMAQYLYRAVEWLGTYNVPVIILSATLPRERREELIIHYMQGRGLKKREMKKQMESFPIGSYPVVTYTDGDLVLQETSFEEMEEKKVAIHFLGEENRMDFLEEKLQNGGIIGIIVNTVKRAQQFTEECSERFGPEMVDLLHSSFIGTHRVKKEEDLMAQIGKGGNRPKGKIIIGTQVMEQSLDIDFDLLISDLAPMDLLIQRIGRLHRHKIPRPKGFEIPQCYVMGRSDILEFEPGSMAVYGGYLLARTQFYLPENVMIPKDIPTLVEKVYGTENICFPHELEVIYNNMKEKEKDKHTKKETKAKVYQILSPGRKKQKSLIGWLSFESLVETEERASQQVRDSLDTIEIIALKKIGNGYGIFGEEEDISLKISDFEIAREVAKQTLKLPSILCMPNNIDATIDQLEAYRIQNLKEWEEIIWLKGALGIVFDEENTFILNGVRLTYDEKLGLKYERM
ncbi:CRISPR-associated helicase Cas3' [Peptoniphilus sp. KCTC 25270]|uniref:CRISPR-associated helicase Cas3' n=1 Tax=Peptoniphilus sp. KCTC 25270 TaxID=2897414 RepID=UPI001E2E0EE8|nr:CRISPR-associated helicase Cas3' [Peptoniphilus sp. KCTC 25270]MCD1147303.1 CRISPR-associated helicase Cas3' [Peptoniphilus sp. KCTC 25270]